MTATDIHSSITPDDTCQWVIMFFALINRLIIISINPIRVSTTTTTIYIATIGIVVGLIGRRCIITIWHDNIVASGNTNSTTINMDCGIVKVMAILTTAIDRALDGWCSEYRT